MTNTNHHVFPTKRHGNTARLLWGSSFLIILLTLLGACLNPFANEIDGDNALVNTPEYRENTGGVRISIGDDGLSAATILPEISLANAIVTYDVLLTGHSESGEDVSELGVSPANFPVSLPSIDVGGWTLSVDARDGEGDIVGTFAEQITISGGMTTSVPVVIRGTQQGTGRLEYTLSWPDADVPGTWGWGVEIIAGTYSINEDDRAMVYSDQLDPDQSIADIVVSDTSFSEAEQRRTISVALDPIASGTYFLVVTLFREGESNAPIIEAAQVYDNRTSSKTVELSEGALSQPPPPPSSFTLNAIGGQVSLSWVPGEPNTAIEYEILRDTWFIAMPLGTVTTWIDDDVNLVPGDTYTYSITAYNLYGASASVSQAVTIPVPEPGLVGQWRFDEGAELVDTSGNGSTLTQSGVQTEPAYSEEPENTGNFYPVLSQDNHGYTVPTPNNLATGFDGHTYSLWFRNTNVDGNGFGTFGQQGTLIRRDRLEGDWSGDRMIFWLGTPGTASSLDMAINNMGVNVDVGYGNGGDLITGEWNMITVVLRYDVSQVLLYANGELAWTSNENSFNAATMVDAGPMYIGRYPNADGGNVVPADRSVFGHIDDVRVYNYPLDENAILALYTDGRQ